VKFRVHIGQDSNRLKTIAFEECNSLYAEAFQDLTIDEITQGNSKGIVSGVRQIINSLEERGFKEAAQNIRDVIEVDTNETVKRDRFKFAKGFRRG
jgi:phosphopantetheine adenylyltransferase